MNKAGTSQQRLNAQFSSQPANAVGSCPLKERKIAIVPVRYALDRSYYDKSPTTLTPLLHDGRWANLPKLHTRSYTLRQLRDGYIYIYNETTKELDSYTYTARTGTYQPLTNSGTDQQQTSSCGGGLPYLLYPREHYLFIAFSKEPWTPRVHELMLSNITYRRSWMRALDLKRYSQTMSAQHTFPLQRIAEAVADVDQGAIINDDRFADCAYSSTAPGEGYENYVVPLAADVFWRGSVPDQDSALCVALDDPLAVLQDLGAQLQIAQAAWFDWQEKYEHKLNIGKIVEGLCGINLEKNQLPASIRNDENKTRQYLSDIETYYAQLSSEEAMTSGVESLISSPIKAPSDGMKQKIIQQYGSLPSDNARRDWEARWKWRKEADLNQARAYIQSHQPEKEVLLERIKTIRHDLKIFAEHIGTEPLKLFIDTGNENTLKSLQADISELLEIIVQDFDAHEWLAKEDIQAKTLFGLLRFGFSEEIKTLLDRKANELVQGIGDNNTIAGRIGELNGFLTHDDLASKAWMQALTKPARDTLNAISIIAKGAGQNIYEKALMALLPVDSQLVKGKNNNLAALLRNTLISHLLTNHPDRIKFDIGFSKNFSAWKSKWLSLVSKRIKIINHWNYPSTSRYNRRSLGRELNKIEKELELLAHKIPTAIDYRNNKYIQILRDEVTKFTSTKIDSLKKWNDSAKALSEKWGSTITWGVVVTNLLNTVVTYQTVSKDTTLSKKDLAKIGSSIAYTGNALSAVFVEVKWGSIKDLKTNVNGKQFSIIQKSALTWEKNSIETQDWGKQLRGFSKRLVGLGSFALIATLLELWDIRDDFKASSTSGESKALIVKGTAVTAMLVIGAIQLTAGTLASTGITPGLTAFAMGPWVAGVAIMAGLIYLAASAALNYFKMDAIGQWLHKCCWSRYPNERLADTPEGRAEEVRSFLEIQLSPSLYIKPTYNEEYYPDPYADGAMTKRTQLNGAWIQILLPKETRDSLVNVNLTASYRPLNILPMSRLTDSLQESFINNGQFKEKSTFGRASNNRLQRDPLAPVCPPMPAEDQEIVWQTWVPLPEQAQYLELQLWYSTDLLSAGVDDRGYRYQLELIKEGQSDQKDSRLSSLDSSTLQIQTLGGRAQGIELPVAY